ERAGAGAADAPRQIGLSARSTRIIQEIEDTARSAQQGGAAFESPAEYAARADAAPTVVRGGVLAP
ncbi:MAG: hypothetical protein WAU78_17635, partial [Roseiarcus sp.]